MISENINPALFEALKRWARNDINDKRYFAPVYSPTEYIPYWQLELTDSQDIFFFNLTFEELSVPYEDVYDPRFTPAFRGPKT